MSVLEELAQSHRSGQVEIAAEVTARALQAFSALDLDALDQSFPGWRDLVRQIVNEGRNKSAILARSYVDLAKKAELGRDAKALVTLDTVVSFDQLTGQLIIAGPAGIKRALRRGVSINEAATVARAKSAAMAESLALDGGRNTILSDKQLVYWQRVCSGKPCAFCAMLASRGPIYKTKAKAAFHPHPDCRCMPMPTFRPGGTNASRTDQSKAYLEQWNELTKGRRGKDALNAFRRGFEPVPVRQESILSLN